MASSFERFFDAQMSYYEAFAHLALRSRLKAALGASLVLGAFVGLVYLVYQPYLVADGRVALAFALLFALLALLSVLPTLVPWLAQYKKTVTAFSTLVGALVGVAWIHSLEGGRLPVLGVLFETEPPAASVLGLFLVLVAFSIGSTLAGSCLSEVQRERSRMAGELQLARGIQERLLPVADVQTPAFSAYGAAQVASEVGGDFFDVVVPETGDDRPSSLVAAIGDVSGHNVAAGLMAALAKGAFRGALGPTTKTRMTAGAPLERDGAADASPSPLPDRIRSVLATMNRAVYAHAGRRYFVSAQVGSFDFDAGRLALGNAGHVPLLHWRAQRGGSVETLAPQSAALGLLPGGAANVATVPFEPGDVFFFYTDGLVEARSPDGAEFGMDRACELLAAAAPDASTPEALCERFFAALAAHTGGAPPGDDVTLLAVRVDR